MEPIGGRNLGEANEAAVYNLYSYLAYKTAPADGLSLRLVVAELDAASKAQSDRKIRDLIRLNILKNAIKEQPRLGESKIGNLTSSVRGLTACTFTNTDGQIFVVFKGTGKGEWIDNGEGLSGIPEENTYIAYGKDGRVVRGKTVKKDYASDQQVEALNWFNYISAKNGWDKNTAVILSGHSKGGNKAQFVALHTDSAAKCFSFDGQGFSPEALTALKIRLGKNFDARRQNIYSLSADNDYINVLGERLMPENQIYYFKSDIGYHYLESMLDSNGKIHPQCEQGELSRYMESVSERLMSLPPSVRRYATLGVMNILQKTLGRETPVNGDTVSVKETVAGIALAVGALLDKPTKS